MRLIDLVRPYLDGLDRIVDRTPARIDLKRYLMLPDEIAYESDRSGAESVEGTGRGTLVLVSLGPDPEVSGDPDVVSATIRCLEPGGRAAILFGWDATNLPFHRILDPLTTASCQVLQVASLDYELIQTAAVIERVESLAPPRNAIGEPVVPEPADELAALRLGIRLANEHAFGEFVARALRASVTRSESDTSGTWFALERTKMQRQLEQREATIGTLEAQIVRLQESTSMRVGRTMIGAARSPRAAIRLPLDLLGIWRKRGS